RAPRAVPAGRPEHRLGRARAQSRRGARARPRPCTRARRRARLAAHPPRRPRHRASAGRIRRPRCGPGGNLMTLEELAARAAAIVDEVERVVVGKREALELVLTGMLADGHVLLEDFPGLAKTLTARSFAQTCDLGFSRIQFTPDLMPADVTGSAIY